MTAGGSPPADVRPASAGDRVVTFLRWGIASVFVAVLAQTSADPDLWGHLRMGADIVGGGRLPADDRYTFTGFPTWVNQSWLSDAFMHLAWALGGTPGLIAGKMALAAATLAVVGATIHRAGVRGPLFELLVFVTLVAIFPSVATVRPQLFSLLLFAVLLDVLARSEGPRPTGLVAVAPIMVVWANLHGAWLLGLTTFALWTAVELVQPPHALRRAATLAGALALACLATLVTPYGLLLWASFRDTMGTSLQDVSEWRSVLESPRAASLVVWLTLTGLAGVGVRAEGRRWSRILILAWLAWSSWRVRRLLPFYGIATVSLVVPYLAALARRAPLRPRPAPSQRPALRAAIVVATLVVLAVSAVLTVRALACLRIDHTREADVPAARFIASNHLRGRMLTYSDWGLYAIWHFAPRVRVSLDGRRELAYPKTELQRHAAIYWNAPSALADVAALAPDYIWLPAKLPVIPTLRTHGWIPIFQSDRSIVLAQPGDTTSYTTPVARDLPPCFPADPD
jgi:hypothetical protein